jgi:HlyD family secretion protein
MLDTTRALRRQIWTGLMALIVFGGAAAAWSTLVPIDGAIIAPGTIAVEANSKKVQHPTGGVVARLMVREGERVAAGALVAVLDDTTLKANLGVIDNELFSLRVRQARLVAERDSQAGFKFPADLVTRANTDAEAKERLDGEARVFAARMNLHNGQRAQLRERIAQLKEEANGLAAQRTALEGQLTLMRTEFTDLKNLLTQGLVQKPRVNAFERELLKNEGLLGEATAKTAQTAGKASEIEIQIGQIERDRVADATKELREIETKIGEYTERRIAAQDQLRRVDIVAPISGLVHQLAVHTVGGVIQGAETLMMIVPENNALIVEARVAPSDIDQVKLDQDTRVRFSAFNQATTPELNGRVFRISADAVRDQQTGQQFYIVGVRVPDGEFARLKDLKVVPGMPVESYIKTGARTAANYLLKPVLDHMGRAMREN